MDTISPISFAIVGLATILVFTLFMIFHLFHHNNNNNKSSSSKERDHPPRVPWCLPIIGNLHQLRGRTPHLSLHHLSVVHGPLLYLHLGSMRALLVSSVDATCEVFKYHDLIFASRPMLHGPWKISYEGKDLAFAPYGEYWRQVRRTCMQELFHARCVRSFRSVREEEVEGVMSGIIDSDGGLVNLSEVSMNLMNDITCRVAFGWRYGGGGGGRERLRELLAVTQSIIGGFFAVDFFPWLEGLYKLLGFDKRLDENFRQLDALFDEVIENHVRQRLKKGDEEKIRSDVEDLVDVLLKLWDEGSVLKSKDHVKAILADIFIAGTDTASSTVIWAMAELVKNPSELHKAQLELRSIISDSKHRVEEDDLPKLHYLKSIIKETLRLHAPAPLLVPRETTETCNVQGYRVPAKTKVFINARDIMRDPNYWRTPEEFIPERFLHAHDGEDETKGQLFRWIPFGAGRRICPGIDFANVAMELALANLLFRFDWKLMDGEIDMEEAPGLTVHKKNPLWLVATQTNRVDSRSSTLTPATTEPTVQDPTVWNQTI